MKVRVERSGNRILLASESPTPGLDRAIPGAYFREKEGLWSLSLDLTTCALIRERFGARLTIGPALTAWARAEKRQRESQAALAHPEADGEVLRLPEFAPKLNAAMESRPYQRAAVRFVADSKGRDSTHRALIADTVGLGKTLEALGSVVEIGTPGPYLVVCPMTAVELTWAPEIRRWLPEAEVVTLPNGRAGKEKILDELLRRYVADQTSLANTWIVVHPAVVRTQTWYICGECGDKTKFRAGPVPELDCGHEKNRKTRTEDDYQFPDLFGFELGAVIADESDQILIRLTGTPNLQRRGMEILRDNVKMGGARIAMSGTPFRSKPHQIWSTLNWLDPVRWSGKWKFIQAYWQTGGYSGYEVIRDGFMDERENLLLDELKDVMIRRTREQVRGDLPAKIYPSNVDPEADGLTAGIYLPMSAGQRKAYDAIVKTGEAQIEGGTLSTLGMLAEITRMKQFAGSEGAMRGGEFHPIAKGNKYDWIVEFLTELGFADKPDRAPCKVVIASQFTKLLNAFAKGVEKDLKLNASTWMGMVTGETRNRKEVQQRFEDVEDKLSILWINTKAGGSSITLDAADVMVILDETFVDDEQQQLEGRIDNRNPERKIAPRSYYYLRSRDSIEESIAAGNAEAKAAGLRILDGPAIARRYRDGLMK